MPQWSGTSVPIARMLGQVDQDDPTNLPSGCAATCKNTDFTRDSTGSALSATTRAGNNLIMQGEPSPGTGFWDFQYEPEFAGDPFFQQMLRFSLTGTLEREYPVGTGRMQPVPVGMFTPPVNSHKIDTQAANLVFSAYSSAAFTAAAAALSTPSAGGSVYNPKTLNYDPLGMKPFGFYWVPTTMVYAKEVVCPSISNSGQQGNGHTYQAQNAGYTGPNEPVWPAGVETDTAWAPEGGTVTEVLSAAQIAAGQTPVTWKELTMVIANRLPVPRAPALTVGSGGTFGAGLDIYIILALYNNQGLTTPGPAAVIVNPPAGASVSVLTPALNTFPSWMQGLNAPYVPTGAFVYVATVPTGNPAPAPSLYDFFASTDIVGLGGVIIVTGPGTPSDPPATLNSARITPGQLPTPTTEPVLVRNPAAGAFPAGRDVWVRLSYSNVLGETPLGPSNSIINTLLNDQIQVVLDSVPEYPQITTVNVYEADVESGLTEPPIASYCKVGSYQVPVTAAINATATGSAPQTVNTTGPGGNVPADTPDGGINASQGYRYAVPAWMNRNETISGFTQAAVSKYIVDEDGWEIAVFNVATGPPNIIGRMVNWTVADGTQAGPFAWIGLVDLQVPTQNQVYPNSFLSDGITIVPTVFLDNVTTSGTFNFTDEFLTAEIDAGAEGNNTTDRLTLMAPPFGVRIDYLLTCNRIAICGVPGYSSGPLISLAADYESFDGPTAAIPITSSSGEICWGVLEYRNQIYAMRERSGVVLTPGNGAPSSWDAKARWSGDQGNGVGPCGPRAFAQNGQFIGFVHRTGFYKFDETTPDMMTKEIPREWATINWRAATTISVAIDDDTHTLRIQAPVGNSMVPNKEFCLSYMEGWLNPVHFSTFAQKAVSQEAARRWSFNDISAYICKRIYRTVPNPPPLPLGPTGVSQTTSDFYISQLAYTTTDQSGVINARTPGVFNDNGAGIDWVYETVSTQAMQKPCKPEGVVTSCVGNGPINVTFIAGRRKMTDNRGPSKVLRCQPMVLDPEGPIDYTRKPDRATDEYWRVRYDNGMQPDVWASLKKAQIYVIPVKAARGSLEGK
jgi:hypothetical protein